MTQNTNAPELIELLFFAYRDFTADADAILDEIGFGRAHHRALHFIDRKPDLSVAELLDLLGITKQSLARVLRNLVEAGYVTQTRNKQDKRKQELRLSEQGVVLITKLRSPQSRRIEDALAKSGHSGHTIMAFLEAMLDDKSLDQRKRLSKPTP